MTLYTKLCDVFYIKNADGSYTKLLNNISDLQTIDNEPPDGDFGLHFDPNESITLTVDRLPKKSRYALLGWMAKGPRRKRQIIKALKVMVGR